MLNYDDLFSESASNRYNLHGKVDDKNSPSEMDQGINCK